MATVEWCRGSGMARTRSRRRSAAHARSDKESVSSYNPVLQAAIYDVVDNQLRDGTPPETRQTLDRLMAEGHIRQEARAGVRRDRSRFAGRSTASMTRRVGARQSASARPAVSSCLPCRRAPRSRRWPPCCDGWRVVAAPQPVCLARRLPYIPLCEVADGQFLEEPREVRPITRADSRSSADRYSMMRCRRRPAPHRRHNRTHRARTRAPL
jgi:hypothetical protein